MVKRALQLSSLLLLITHVLGQQAPPGQPVITGPENVISGTTVTYTCKSSGGKPSPTVKWYNGQVLMDDSFDIEGDNVTNSYTFVADPSLNLGVLECQVFNNVLQNPLSITQFMLVYSEPSTPVLTGPSQIIEGDAATHRCVSSGGYPMVTMTMRLENVDITSQTTENIATDPISKSYTVTKEITWNPTLSDNGKTIYCEVTHPETRPNNPQVVSIPLTVKVALSINAPVLQYTGTVGNSITLQCVVTGTATQISWTKDGSTLNINSNSRLSNGNVNNPSLTITNIVASDEGSYVCLATDGTKTVNTNTITLTSQSLPIVNIQQSTYSAQYGNPITLVCTVSAKPFQSQVYWEKDGQRISAGGSGYSGSTVNTPSLTITFVRTSDQGQYRCYATNVVGTGSSSTTTLSVQGGLLSVTIAQRSFQAVLGTNSLTMGCTVTGSPAASSVTWRKTIGAQTTNIDVSSNSGKYQGSSVGNPSLTILNIEQSDEASYTCTATNIAGTSTSETAQLDVTGSIPTVNIRSPTYSVLYGNTITLECTVNANPTHNTVTWQRIVNGSPSTLNIGNASKYSGGSVTNPSLTILNAVSADSGNYRCSATNVVGTGFSQDTTLTVTGDVPIVSISSSAYQVLVGNRITLGCTVTANPFAQTVEWEREISGTVIRIGSSTNPSKYSGSTTVDPSLTINNVDFSDEGNYRCFATNIVGTGQSSQAFLDVFGQPPIVSIPLPKYSVSFGQTVTIGCTVTANPVHTKVYWRRTVNGESTEVVIDQNKYSGSTVSQPSLVIRNANLNDEGSYSCFAENSIGMGQSLSTVLDVLGNIPSVVVPQRQYNVDYGKSVTLTCTVTADPIHTLVYWDKIIGTDATRIDVANSNQKYDGSTVQFPSLTINNVNLNDEGSYICLATNGVGTGQSAQTTVDVAGGIPSVAILSNSYSVLVSGTVTLQCVVSANPTHTVIQWQKVVGGQLRNVAIGGRLSGSQVNSPSLTISSAEFSDEGNYLCTATNAVGTGSSLQTFLDVTGTLPIVTVSQSQYNGDYGQAITLVCTVSANPKETRVYWKRLENGLMNEITLNSVKYGGSSVSQPSLTINSLGISDEGFYKCFADNSVGTGSSAETFLDVLGNVPSVRVLLNTYTAILGNSITLGCEVIATPKETSVFWRRISVNNQEKDIRLSDHGNKYSGSMVGNPSLTINNVDDSDEGSYLCIASNIVGQGFSSRTYLYVEGSIPIVTIAQTYYSVNIRNPITLFCTVSATPPETNVFWTKIIDSQNSQNELTIEQTNAAKYGGSTVSSPSLIIKDTDLSDNGRYRCHATNVVGTGSSNSTELSVMGNLPIVRVDLPSYNVNYGDSITLVCTVTAAPTHTSVFWKKIQGGQQLTIDTSNAKYSGSTVQNPSLTIFNTDVTDETYYICYASNSLGLGQSSQTYLDVIGSIPSVTVLSNSYQVLLGQTATLECKFFADPSATMVQWYKIINQNRELVDTSDPRFNSPTVLSPFLVISNAQESDDGYYICTASNIVGMGSSAQTYLDVTGNVPTVTVSLPTYNTNIGATVTLGCTVVAQPAATSVFWKRIGSNGQTLDIDINSQRYDGASISSPSLIIYNPQLSDEGNYVCYATNAIGTGQSQRTFLDVTGNIPTVQVLKSLYSVNIGQSVTLECTVTASPSHTVVYWQKVVGGVATTISASSQQNKYSGSTVSNPSLTVSAAASSDEAYYICFATNEVGTGQSAQTYLDVVGGIPIVNIGSNSYSVNYGNSVTLVCTVTANPVHNSVTWSKIQNGVSSPISVDGSKYSGATISQPSLVVNNAGNSDEAFYICSATNSVGKGQSSQTYLDVVGAIPVVQILSNYYSAEIGNSVTVECQIQADPAHNSVQWQRVENGIATDLDVSNSNKYYGGTRNTPSLTIQNTVDSDEGYYICTATNAVGTGTSSQSYVDITGSILSVTVPQPTYSVNYGQSVQLVCTVSGNPPANSVYWVKVKNGVQTTINSNTNSNKYSGVTLNQPSLTVLNADATDQAVYTCFAENVIGKSQSQQTQLQVIGSIPSVTIGQGYTVNLGSSVTIQCTVFATPSATSVTWKRISNNGGENIINVASNSGKYTGGSVNTPSLTIMNAVDSDEAYYVCSATNAAGTGTSTQSYLDVLGSIPVVTIPQPQYSVTVGNDITMECNIDANPAYNGVQWRKIVNGQPQDISMGSRFSGSAVGNPSLTITGARSTDAGYYVCYASNSVGTGQSAQTYLNVVGSLPVVTVLSTSYSVNIDNVITLQCTVSASPPHTTVMWQRIVNNQAVNVDMSDSRYAGSTVSNPSLVISNARGTDEGYYICMASNSVGTGQSQQTFLDVVGSIPTVTVPVPTYTVNRGASVTLECQYTANPAATSVTWEKIVNGQAVDITVSGSSNKYQGSTTQSPSLIVNNAEEADQASYICKVTNNIGTGISSATTLDVVGNIPIVTAPQLAYSVNIGGSVTIRCTVTADPLHTIVQWKKIVGGATTNIVVGNSNGKYDGSSVNSPSLIINNAAFSDQGTYVCHATNSVGTGQSTQVVVAVAGSVPSVTLSKTSFTGNYGEAITLGCIISSNPTYTSVYWQKTVAGANSVTIDLTNTDKYSGSTVTDPDLTIKNLGTGDVANYVCFAANSVGTGRSNASPLNVVGNIPQVRISQTTYPINIGNTITIDCSVIASPTHTTVYWTRQIGSNPEETIDTTGSSSTKFGGSTVASPSLIIYSADETDQGTYICHATNIVGTGQSSQAFLDVVGNVPTVSATTVQSTRVGSTVTIQCTVISNPDAIDVTWAKFINNQPTPIDIVNNNRLSGGTVQSPSLVINPVEQDDEGNYICQARNEVGTGSSNQVYLDITGDPPSQISVNPTKIMVEEGQTVTATCLAIASPEPTYSWYKGDSNNANNVILFTGKTMEIRNAPQSAAGTYTCRASNNYGSMEASTIVDVQYKPVVTISDTLSSFDGVGRSSVNIPCSYRSNPAATSVIWTKFNPVEGTNSGNTKVIAIDGTKYQGGNLNSPSLTIYNLGKDDEGSYRCSATNIIGRGDSNYVTLNVDTNARPGYIRITPSQVVIKEGSGYTLTCEADGDPAPIYEWYYKDQKIHEGAILTITNAKYTKNDGLHTCEATNTVGSRQATVDVDVKYIPISDVSQSIFRPGLNNPVTLSCDTKANPSATDWSWEYNGHNLNYNGKNYLVDMDSTTDIGMYTCIAYNEVGQSVKIEFTVDLADPATPAPEIRETLKLAGLTGGEIAAIILAILFGILLIVILIVCCVAQGCCRRKKRVEKERYVEREIVAQPIQYKTETVPVIREPSVVSVREVTPRITYVSNDSSYGYVTQPSQYVTQSSRPYYLPVVEATYDDEEMRRRNKKKKKRSRKYQDELARDDGIYLEERIVGSVRGSAKGEEIISGPEMYFEAE